VVLDRKEKEDDKGKWRWMEELVMALDCPDIQSEHIDRVRDDVLALHPFDSKSDDLDMEEGGWQLTSFDFDESAFEE
jgi:hypothetical protein